MRTTTLAWGHGSRRLFSCCTCSPFDVSTSSHFKLLAQVSLHFSTNIYLRRRATSDNKLLLSINVWKAAVGSSEWPPAWWWRCKKEKDALAAPLQRRRSCGRTLPKAAGSVARTVTYHSWKAALKFSECRKMSFSSEGNLIRARHCWNLLNATVKVASVTGKVSTCTRLLGLSSADDFV